MDDAAHVRVVQRACHLGEQGTRLAEAQPAAALEQLPQRPPAGTASRCSGRHHPTDRRRRSGRCSGARGSPPSWLRGGSARQRGSAATGRRQDLQRHEAAQAVLARAIDRRHAAATQHVQNLIRTESAAGRHLVHANAGDSPLWPQTPLSLRLRSGCGRPRLGSRAVLLRRRRALQLALAASVLPTPFLQVTSTPFASVRPGIDVLLQDRSDLVCGARIGLVTNQTGIDASGASTIDRLCRQPSRAVRRAVQPRARDSR